MPSRKYGLKAKTLRTMAPVQMSCNKTNTNKRVSKSISSGKVVHKETRVPE